jgi:hypothetical protein
MNQFTLWQKWDSRTSLPNLGCPGIYAIAIHSECLDGKKFDWIKEIVYIGMTNSKGGLKSRLKQFDYVLKGKTGHGGAERFMHDWQEDMKILNSQLYVAVAPHTCNVLTIGQKDLVEMGNVAKAEYEAWAAYAEKYAALPKYNLKISPKRPGKTGL